MAKFPATWDITHKDIPDGWEVIHVSESKPGDVLQFHYSKSTDRREHGERFTKRRVVVVESADDGHDGQNPWVAKAAETGQDWAVKVALHPQDNEYQPDSYRTFLSARIGAMGRVLRLNRTAFTRIFD